MRADADAFEALRQHVVVGARRRHELDAARAQAAHGAEDVGHRERRVLDAVAAVVLGEDVDLRFLEEGPERLVVGELDARGRIPHHHRLQPRAVLALLRRRDVVGVERDLPELLEAQHVLHPQQRRLHGLEVRGQVIDALKPKRLPPRRRRPGAATKPGNSGAVAAALDEAEGGVAERRGDREHRQRAPVVGEALHVGDERAAALVEQRGRRGRCPRPRTPPCPRPRGACAGSARRGRPRPTGWWITNDRVAGLERRRALPALALQLGAAGARARRSRACRRRSAASARDRARSSAAPRSADAKGLTLRHPRNCNVDCARREVFRGPPPRR